MKRLILLASLFMMGCGSAEVVPSGSAPAPSAQPSSAPGDTPMEPSGLRSHETINPEEPMLPSPTAVAGSKLPPEKALAGRERVASVGSARSVGGHVVDMDKVVSKMTPEFTRCYKVGLSKDPQISGTFHVTIKIGTKGQVVSATPAGGDGLSTEVITCAIHVVEAAKFSPPEGGDATITIPIFMSW